MQSPTQLGLHLGKICIDRSMNKHTNKHCKLEGINGAQGWRNAFVERLVQQDKLRLQNYGRKYSEAGQPGQVNVQLWRHSDQGEETVRISPAQRAEASAFIHHFVN